VIKLNLLPRKLRLPKYVRQCEGILELLEKCSQVYLAVKPDIPATLSAFFTYFTLSITNNSKSSVLLHHPNLFSICILFFYLLYLCTWPFYLLLSPPSLLQAKLVSKVLTHSLLKVASRTGMAYSPLYPLTFFMVELLGKAIHLICSTV
jgi:hypothetical protein